MEINHENLEQVIKILMDKMKFKLGLKFRSEDYIVILRDNLPNDVMLKRGEQVVVLIRTERLANVFNNKKESYQFKRLLESCLRLIPRMQGTLSKPAIADILLYNSETERFRKLSQKQFDAKYPPVPYEKEINYRVEYLCEAIHMKCGIVVREHGKHPEIAKNKARAKVLKILQDPEIYNRSEDGWVYMEPHEDAIYDIIVDAKVLNREEVEQLIRRLTEEYLK